MRTKQPPALAHVDVDGEKADPDALPHLDDEGSVWRPERGAGDPEVVTEWLNDTTARVDDENCVPGPEGVRRVMEEGESTTIG
jgi:hypothetical protein